MTLQQGLVAGAMQTEVVTLGPEDRLDLAECARLLHDWSREFIERSYVTAHRINIAAEFFMQSAVRRLERAGADASVVLAQSEGTVVHRAMDLLADGDGGRDAFLDLFGHRAIVLESTMERIAHFFGGRRPRRFREVDPRFTEQPDLAGVESGDTGFENGHVGSRHADDPGRCLCLFHAAFSG